MSRITTWAEIRRSGVRALGFLVLFTAALPVWAEAALWRDIQASDVQQRGQRLPEPLRYRAMSLDYAAMRTRLADAPLEAIVPVDESEFVLALPMPDGRFADFRVVESPIMESKLADKYPMLKTYLGQGIDDPTATLRFDLTSFGFRAQVIGWRETVYIEPFQRSDTEHYRVFSKDDYRKTGQPLVCSVTGEVLKNLPNFQKRGVVPKISSGANLRTYRLAMAATGEYTAVLGGTVLDGLSGIVTTVNRVNGIYEREVSVRMILVANTDLLIYTNAATDPYANTSADLAANQTNITNVIGTANFDFGHLVGTGGGGVAGLGVICNTSNKARGLTGSPNPIADAYDVDYVAHEMGHQFAGNHTFNGSGGSCSGGNRNGSTGYEPGSGLTIQAYAGICGGDNVQPNSEDYFHRVSLNEILAFSTNAGTGGSCGVLTSTGNGVPTVSAPAAVTIPISTPFSLTATGSDPNADTLTYVWEQFDLGTANPEGSIVDTANRPIFRSFDPTPSPTRIFPSLRYILNNANVAPATAALPGTTTPTTWLTAEVLPTTGRTMNFRVTARDNRAGGGGTNEASVAVTSTTSAGPFIVTAPDTAVSWAAGSSQTIIWNVAGTTANGVNTANVEIALSRDGGLTFPTILAASTPNDGSETLTIPAGTPATTQARIRVAAVGNIFFDIGNANFTITGSNSAPTLTNITSVTTRQGSPAVVGNIATVADGQDLAGNLNVALSDVPPEMTASVVNSGGTVALTAAASCTLVTPTSSNKTYPIQLTVTDSAGASTTLPINVLVGSNQIPTLGTYTNVNMPRSSSSTATPSAPISDANNNLSAASVSPSTLPGGGTVTIAANGNVTITTTAATTFGTYTISAQANDSCGAARIRRFTVTVAASSPVLAIAQSNVLTGNNLIEPNECNQLNVSLNNTGTVTATAVSATLSTTDPNITITQATAAFPDIAAGASGTSLTPFQVSSSNALVCLSNIAFNLTVIYTGGGSPATLSFNVPVGQAGVTSNYAFASASNTIPAGGVLLAGSQGDDVTAALTVPAGFSFTLFGNTIAGGSATTVSSNGNLAFAATSSNAYTNSTLPITATAGSGVIGVFPASAPTLFPYWDDLDTSGAGNGVFTNLVGTAPNRTWIVEWKGITFTGNVAVNFAIVFSEGSNNFQYRYNNAATANGSGATIGVQAASSGTAFTQFSFNAAAVSVGQQLTASQATTPLICSSGTGTCAGTSVASIAVAPATVTEDGASNLIYTVSLSPAAASPTTINLTTSGTATSGTDYTGGVPSILIAAGASSGTVTIDPTADTLIEPDETVILTLATGSGYSISSPASATGAITNDDLPVASIAVAPASVLEDGAVNLVYTVTFNQSALSPTTVNLTTTGTATSGVDYTGAMATLLIPTGNTTGTVTIDPTADTAIESDETVILTLAAGSGYSLGVPASVTGTITNDDNAPTFTPAAAISRQQGSPTSLASLGTVSDQTDPAGSLTVAFNGGTATGLTNTGLANTAGAISASIAASCTAVSGTLRVQVTDLAGLTGTGDVQVNVNANTPPSLSYANFNVGFSGATTQNPSTGPSDNGSVTSLAVQNAGTYTGGISVNSAGIISLSNARPVGTHAITLRATDNCGATTDAVVQVTVNQATTVKELTSNISPSRFGQTVIFTAQLSGVDPTGSVEFFAGALSLGTAPLTPNPGGGTSIKLASLSTSTLAVGANNITVRYLGDSNNAGSTSAILVQTVQAADTAVSLSPAANPAAIGSSTFNVQVQAIAPGGGTPAGTVTLNAGAGNTCNATLTAGTGSCALNFAAAGFVAISASYTPANGNHAASTGSSSLVVVSTPSNTDLRVRIGNGGRNIGAGQTLRYDILVDNLGTQAAVGRLQVPLSSDFSGASFTCLATGAASCPSASAGTGSIDKEVSVAPGGVVIYSLTVTAPLDPERIITQSANITAKAPTTDINLSNNDASDIDPMGLLADGYEDPSISE